MNDTPYKILINEETGLTLDIEKDVRTYLIWYLKEHKLKLPKNYKKATFKKLLQAYFNFHIKIIPCNKYKVNISDELFNKLNNSYGNIILQIVNDARNGRDLNIYQSKFLSRPLKNDKLLNNWGINHLHLSLELETNQSQKLRPYVKRTEYLLFIAIREDNLFLIDVLSHNKGGKIPPWCNKNLLYVIDNNNWENLLFDEMEDITPTDFNQKDICTLHNKNIGYILNFKNKSYMYPFGTMSDSTNVIVVKNIITFNNHLKNFVNCIKNQIDQIKQDTINSTSLTLDFNTKDSDQIKVSKFLPCATLITK